MSKPREPKIDSPRVTANAFKKMNADDIQSWLKGRFLDAWSEYCPSVLDIGGAVTWTGNAFPDFPEELKTRFADAVAPLLDELQQQPDKWKPFQACGLSEPHDPAVELLLFTERVIPHVSNADKAKLQAKSCELVESAAVLDKTKYRVLSILNTSEYIAPDAFWIDLHRKLPKATAPIFSAIARQHPKEAFEFLAAQPWIDPQDSFDRFALAYELAVIQNTHGKDIVDRGLARLAEAHPEAQHQLAAIAHKTDKIIKNAAAATR